MSPGSKNNTIGNEPNRLASKAPTLWLRAHIIQSIRQFFIGKGYLEIETPHLIPAPAPECHIDALEAGHQFLHTSPELCMKRLLAAGYKKIFQICRCFRQDERGERHIPEFTTSIALAVGEKVQVGVIYDPLRDELFSAVAGRGVWCNGRPVQVSRIDHLDDAVGGFDWGHSNQDRQTAIQAFQAFAPHLTSIRGFGSAALALAYVAAGRLDLYFNPSLKAWDIAAGSLMIAEAGGQCAPVGGQTWTWQPPAGTPASISVGCLASNGLLHDEIQHRFDTIP